MNDFLSKFTKKDEGFDEVNQYPEERGELSSKKDKIVSDEATLEVDPDFRRKQQKRYFYLVMFIILFCSGIGWGYYQWMFVKIPDFIGKDITIAQKWGADNKVKVDVEQIYDKNQALNQIIKQATGANKKLKKGGSLDVTVSLGADPNEQLTLPSLTNLPKQDAETWKKVNFADNFAIIEEYSDTVEKGALLRLEFANKDVNETNYKRKDVAKLYYSKGKEVFEKNIVVPDFYNKPVGEVENWAKNNELDLEIIEVVANDIELGKIVYQSVAKGEKVAKRDAFAVSVSLGKGILVPNFSLYTPEEAVSAASGLIVQVRYQYSETVPYGHLISQNRSAGIELTTNDDLTVIPIYSVGRPYLKDLRGTTVEGDLPKIFFDEFQSKGANITYQVRYVDSAEPYGTVVGMSHVNVYLPMEHTITIDISLGNL